MGESLKAVSYHQVMLTRYHVRSGGENTKQKRSLFSEAFQVESLAKQKRGRHGVHSVAQIWYSGRPITKEPSIGCDGRREEKGMGHRRAPPALMLLLPLCSPQIMPPVSWPRYILASWELPLSGVSQQMHSSNHLQILWSLRCFQNTL